MKSLSRSLVGVLVGLLLAGLFVQISGYNAISAGSSLWQGATGIESNEVRGWHLNHYLLAQSLSKMTPLLLCGLSVMLGLKAGLFNIGGQGQMILGALAAAWIGAKPISSSPAIQVPLVLLAGIGAGMVWGLVPGWLKAKRGVHEALATIMLNYIAADVADYLVRGTLRDTNSMATQTGPIQSSAWLTPLVTGSNLTAGLMISLTICLIIGFAIQRTSWGFRLRAVGLGADAAKASGMKVPDIQMRTMAICGGLAGLAGAIEVMSVHHRWVEGIAGTYGFDGIGVALLGGLNASGTLLSSLFFGMLNSGAGYMKTQTDVPDSLAVIIQALVIIAVGVRFSRAQRANKEVKP